MINAYPVRLLPLLVALSMAELGMAQQPAPKPTPSAPSEAAVSLTPQEQLELSTVQKDVTIAQLQLQNLQAQYEKYQASLKQQLDDAQRTRESRLAIMRKAHGLSDDYQFNGTAFVKAPKPAPESKPAPAPPKQ